MQKKQKKWHWYDYSALIGVVIGGAQLLTGTLGFFTALLMVGCAALWGIPWCRSLLAAVERREPAQAQTPATIPVTDRVCAVCQHALPPEALYCPACGRRLGEAI